MNGLTEIAEQVFELPVRRATPTGVGPLADAVATPAFATAVGLAVWGHEHGARDGARVSAGGFSLGRLGGRVREWLTDIFEPASSAAGNRRASR